MPNHVYPELIRAGAEGELGDLQSLTWVAQLYDDQTYDPTNLVRNDLLGTPVGDPLVLPSVLVVVVGGGTDHVQLMCDDAGLNLSGVTALDIPEQLLVYIDTGDPLTDTLAAYYDRRADTSPVEFVGTGLAVRITFPLGYFIRL